MTDKRVIPVTGVDQAGIIRDVPAHALPPQAWSDGRNIRFKDGTVRKREGTVRAFNDLPAGDSYVHLAYWPEPLAPRYMEVASRITGSAINYHLSQITEDNTRTDLTPTSGDEFTTGGIPRNPFGNYLIRDGDWQTALFTGGYNFIINNGFNTPAYFNQDMTRFEALPGWNYVSDRWISAKVVRGVGNRLIAGNLTHRLRTDLTMSQNFPGTIRLSTLAAAGDVPDTWEPLLTNTADEFELSNTSAVQDIVPLQGQAIVYTTDSIHSVNIQGADAQVRTVAEGYGALTTGAVIEFDGRHLVVGSDDIYIFGGHPGSIQSVADGKIREFFFNDLNPLPEVQGNLFILRDKAIDEIQIFYPTGSSLGEADRYLAWNYRNNTWSINDAPDLVSGAVGPIRGGGVAEITSVLTGTGNEEADPTREQQTITISDVTLDGPIREQQRTRLRRAANGTSIARASTFTEEVFGIGIRDDIIPTNRSVDTFTFAGNTGTPNRDIGTQTGTATVAGSPNALGTSSLTLDIARVNRDGLTGSQTQSSDTAQDLTVDGVLLGQTDRNTIRAAGDEAAQTHTLTHTSGTRTFSQTGRSDTVVTVTAGGTRTARGTGNFIGTGLRTVTVTNADGTSFDLRFNVTSAPGGGGQIVQGGALPAGTSNLQFNPTGLSAAEVMGGYTITASVDYTAADVYSFTGGVVDTANGWTPNTAPSIAGNTLTIPRITRTALFSYSFTRAADITGGTITGTTTSTTDTSRTVGISGATQTNGSRTFTLGPAAIATDGSAVSVVVGGITLTQADRTRTINSVSDSFSWSASGTVPVVAETGTLNADGTFATGTTTGISGFTGLDLTVANGAFGGIPMTGDTFSLPGSTVAATYTRTQGSQSYEHDFNTNQFRRSGTALGTPRIPTQAEFDAAVRNTGVFDRNLLPNGIYVEFQDQVGSTADDSNRIYQVLNGVTTNLFLAGTNIPASASVGTNNQGVLTLGADASVNLAGLRYTLTNGTEDTTAMPPRPLVSFPEVNLTVDGNTSTTTSLTTAGSTAVVDVGGVSAGDTWSVSLGEADQFDFVQGATVLLDDIQFPGGLEGAAQAAFFAAQVNALNNFEAEATGAEATVRYRSDSTGNTDALDVVITNNTGDASETRTQGARLGAQFVQYNWEIRNALNAMVTSGSYSPDGIADTAATIVQELAQDIVDANAGWELDLPIQSFNDQQVIHINTNDSANLSLMISVVDNDAANTAISESIGATIEGDGNTPDTIAINAAPNPAGTTPTNYMVTAFSGEGAHRLATRIAAAITNGDENPSDWTAAVDTADTLETRAFTFLTDSGEADATVFTRWTGAAVDFTGFNPDDTGTAESVTPLYFDGTDTYIWVRQSSGGLHNNLHISQTTATAGTWAFAARPLEGIDPVAVNDWTEVTGDAPGTQIARANAVVFGPNDVDFTKTADEAGVHPGLWTYTYTPGTNTDGNLEFGDTSVTREGTNHSVRIDVTSPIDGTTVNMIFSDGTDEQGVATDLATGLMALPYIRTAAVDGTNDAQVNITYEAEDYVVNAARGLVLNPLNADGEGGQRDVPAADKVPTFAVAFPAAPAAGADATTDNSANIMADDFMASAIGPNDVTTGPTPSDPNLLVRGHPRIEATVISVTIGTRTETITAPNNATTQQLTTNLFNLITSQFSREVTASLIDSTTINIVTRNFGDSLLTLRIFFDNVTRQDNPESFIRSDAPTVTPDRISSNNDQTRPWRTNQFNLGREFVITASQNGQSFGHGFGFTAGAAPVNTVNNTDAIAGTPYNSYVERIHNPLDGEVEYTKATEYVQLLLSEGDTDVLLGMTDSPGDLRNLYVDENGTDITTRTFFRENDYKVDFRRHGRLFNLRISDPTRIVDATTDTSRARTSEDPATGWRVAGYGLSAGREEQRGGRR